MEFAFDNKKTTLFRVVRGLRVQLRCNAGRWCGCCHRCRLRKMFLPLFLNRWICVLERGLEPPRPKALVPKTSVYTNFTTPAWFTRNERVD